MPKWSSVDSLNIHRSILICMVSPVALGTLAIHLGADVDRRKTKVATIDFAAGTQALRSSFHSGFQRCMFGLPARTLEYHPIGSAIRYLSPCLPLALVLVSSRASSELPHLAARYIVYSYAICLGLDLLMFYARALPLTSLNKSFQLFGILTICMVGLMSDDNISLYSV